MGSIYLPWSLGDCSPRPARLRFLQPLVGGPGGWLAARGPGSPFRNLRRNPEARGAVRAVPAQVRARLGGAGAVAAGAEQPAGPGSRSTGHLCTHHLAQMQTACPRPDTVGSHVLTPLLGRSDMSRFSCPCFKRSRPLRAFPPRSQPRSISWETWNHAGPAKGPCRQGKMKPRCSDLVGKGGLGSACGFGAVLHPAGSPVPAGQGGEHGIRAARCTARGRGACELRGWK